MTGTTVYPRGAQIQWRCLPFAALSADTEVFYMAGRQLATLGSKLLGAGWPADTPALVVSRAGWPDALGSEHSLAELAAAAVLGLSLLLALPAWAQAPAAQAQPILEVRVSQAPPTLALAALPGAAAPLPGVPV